MMASKVMAKLGFGNPLKLIFFATIIYLFPFDLPSFVWLAL
jgi:hypothetical protein